MEFFKNLLKKANEKDPDNTDKKKLSKNQIIAVVILAGIILIIGGSSFTKKDNTGTNGLSADGSGNKSSGEEGIDAKGQKTRNELEEKRVCTEEILSKIKGAGNVSVMITYETTKEKIPLRDESITENETNEKTDGGGERNATEKQNQSTVVFEDSSGNSKNVVIGKENEAKVRGVLIVYTGPKDTNVKAELIKAAQVLFDVPVHKIHVVQG